ncbi:hypothetical protein N7507_003659 [Penicillium longicatenatum]|nr:hypothetical protein N7507_003659 [Penicillium longicatenatum]
MPLADIEVFESPIRPSKDSHNVHLLGSHSPSLCGSQAYSIYKNLDLSLSHKVPSIVIARKGPGLSMDTKMTGRAQYSSHVESLAMTSTVNGAYDSVSEQVIVAF